MKYTGKAHKLGDDINTDYISPGRYKSRNVTYEELAAHIMEDIDPDFHSRLAPGDFIAAGNNFGCGSSRETAPRVILAAKINVVLAKSFARIFFRNAISLGLPLVECDTDQIGEGESIEVDIVAGTVTKADGTVLQGRPIPPELARCLMEGGMLANFEKYGTFRLD